MTEPHQTDALVAELIGPHHMSIQSATRAVIREWYDENVAPLIAPLTGSVLESRDAWKRGCEEAEAKLAAALSALGGFPCTCRYYGDGDWGMCSRCIGMGIRR